MNPVQCRCCMEGVCFQNATENIGKVRAYGDFRARIPACAYFLEAASHGVRKVEILFLQVKWLRMFMRSFVLQGLIRALFFYCITKIT